MRPILDRRVQMVRKHDDCGNIEWIFLLRFLERRPQRVDVSDQFDCYWRRREKLSPAECARDDEKCAKILAMLKIGTDSEE